MSAEPGAPGPRSLLAMLAAYAGLTLVVVLASTIAGAIERAPPTSPAPADAPASAPGPELLAFFGPLVGGEPFAGWTLERVDGPQAGGLPALLRGPAGQRVTVELRPRDARSPPSPATTETLAIYVRDREMPPDGLAGVLALAQALREREAAGARLVGLTPLLFTP